MIMIFKIFFLNCCLVSKLELPWDGMVGFFNDRAATVFVKYNDVAK